MRPMLPSSVSAHFGEPESTTPGREYTLAASGFPRISGHSLDLRTEPPVRPSTGPGENCIDRRRSCRITREQGPSWRQLARLRRGAHPAQGLGFGKGTTQVAVREARGHGLERRARFGEFGRRLLDAAGPSEQLAERQAAPPV